MPDRQALYLFKAARRPYYHKENLQLLAAERGSVIEVAYNRMWVAPEYFTDGAVPRGTTVYFAFTERPYSTFVPVRQGEVIDAQRDELMLRLRVLLGSWIGIEEELDLTSFTRLVKQSQPTLAPGNKFVIPKRDGIRLMPFVEEQEDLGWKRVVDQVLQMSRASEDDPYRGSVFFRPVGLQIGGEVHIARRVPLQEGADASLLLRFYNPHLSEQDAAAHELKVLASEHTLAGEPPTAFPLIGDLELALAPIGDQNDVTVQIGPAPAQHTSATHRFTVQTTAEKPDSPRASGNPGTSAPRDELMRLYEFVQRNARFDDDDALDVLDAFERILPDEPRIRDRRAILLAGQGRDDLAFRELRDLSPKALSDDAAFLYFKLLLKNDQKGSPVRHVINLDLATEGRFPRLLGELAQTDERTLGRLLPDLIIELPRDQLRDLLEAVGHRVSSPTPLAETARNLCIATEDPKWAYAYLQSRRRELRIDDPAVEDALIEIGALGGTDELDDELVDVTSHRIGNLIERGRTDEALKRLAQIQARLRDTEREHLYRSVADRLIRQNQDDKAAEVLVDLAWAACTSGDLDTANEALLRARTLMVQVGDELPAWFTQAMDHVTRALEDCEELIAWRETMDARVQQALRQYLLGKRILIAGGLKKTDWVEHLRLFTGSEIEWAEQRRDEGGQLHRFAARIQQGSYVAVLHLWQRASHDVRNQLKDACAATGTPFLKATSNGKRGLVQALALHFHNVRRG
jgi:hypothetical protein